MDLSQYSLKDVLLAAIKSEVESRRVYQTLADMVKNAFLKNRLTFLAGEEDKHRVYIEGLFRKWIPGADIVLPEKTPVPLPAFAVPAEDVLLSEVIKDAMEAERASSEFYEGLATLFDDPSVKKTLQYFAAMEMNHYRILEAEQVTMKRFEDFDVEWPMMNVGP
jgi:rubrerythrin